MDLLDYTGTHLGRAVLPISGYAYGFDEATMRMAFLDWDERWCLSLFDLFSPFALGCAWRPEWHAGMPSSVRCVVTSFTEIRTLCLESVVSLLPNELLFEIFSHLY